jgi:hypothetical protein
VDASELAPRLWRWTAPHPEWVAGAEPGSPDDWDEVVGSVLYDTGEAAVFIDPLLPPDEASFWRWADERVGSRAVHVVTTVAPHRRDRDRVAARYGASTSRARRSLPAGVESVIVRGAAETMFWLPEPGALVPGDRLLGADGGNLRLCPESWLSYVAVDRARLRVALLPILDLPVQRVLVSHGEPVLDDALEALRRCLAA